LANQSWLFDGEIGVNVADREKRTAGCIAKHPLQWAEYTVWAKFDARTGGVSGNDCL
jgi:hypothetical protein